MGTDRQTDGQTDRRRDGQTQVTTITLRPKRPRVKKPMQQQPQCWASSHRIVSTRRVLTERKPSKCYGQTRASGEEAIYALHSSHFEIDQYHEYESDCIPAIRKTWYTMRLLYNAINFLQNPQKCHPIATHKGELWDVYCKFEIWFMLCCGHCFVRCDIMIYCITL